MKLLISSLLLVIFNSINIVKGFTETCKYLSVSTNITDNKNDVIKNGKINKYWAPNSQDPIFTQTSLEIDYFYLTITDQKQKLQDKDLKLSVDDSFFSDSTARIIDSKNRGKNVWQYTVAIKYRNRNYGGALLTYNLEFLIPNCGSNTVSWKKVAGSPLSPRNGLSLDIAVNRKYNQTVAQNGVLLKASYFDEDLDNFVFTVPKNQKQSVFYLYMDVDEDQQYIVSDDLDPFELLTNALMMIPNERIDPLFVDGDEMIMNPIVEGKVVNGGQVTTDKVKITLKYNCKRHGSSKVQLQIPLPYFKDLNLFFKKECPHSLGTEAWEIEQQIGFVSIFTLCLFFGLLGGTLYNIIYKNQKGIDAIPFLRVTIEFLMDFTVVRNIVSQSKEYFNDQIGRIKKSDGYQSVSTNSQNHDQEKQQNNNTDSEGSSQGYEQVPLDEIKKDTTYGSL